MPGRPRALDEAKRREVCALVSAGCGIDGAARYVGCNAITIRREALRNPEFYEQLRNAELNAQISPLQALRKAASTHWRAAAWFLERTQPKQFARKDPQALSPDDLKIWMERIAKSLFDEVNDSEMVERILKRLAAVEADCERDLRAGQAARPDVHARRRRQAKGFLTREGTDNSKRNATPICTPASTSEAGIPDNRPLSDRQNSRIMSPESGTPASPTECKP